MRLVINQYVCHPLIGTANYPADRMDAIRNYYELVKDGTAGDKVEECTAEYLAMQEWRAYCKQLANGIFIEKTLRE